MAQVANRQIEKGPQPKRCGLRFFCGRIQQLLMLSIKAKYVMGPLIFCAWNGQTGVYSANQIALVRFGSVQIRSGVNAVNVQGVEGVLLHGISGQGSQVYRLRR